MGGIGRKRLKTSRRLTLAAITRAVPIARAAELLCGAGRRVTAAQIRAHVRLGAPTAGRGRIRLLEYAAWLVRQLEARDGG